MYILGIESSCDETAAAVVEMSQDKRKILSNTVATQIATHALYGGVVPEIASRAHIEAITPTVRDAIQKSGISLDDIDAVAVTYTPGLIGSLLVGVSFAKSLAYSLGVPLIPVDHIKAHTAAAYFDAPKLKAPFLSLVVSGGHTSLYHVTAPDTFIEIGSTRDDAAGEAFDKVGRVMGLNYPGGAAMDKLAASGMQKEKSKLSFPSPAINDSSLDYSFSGLKTACVNYIHNLKQKSQLSDSDNIELCDKEEIACAFTSSVVKGICIKLEKAIVETGEKNLVLAGGVAANSHLRAGVKRCCDSLGVDLYVPPVSLCGDNGAMVAAQGYFEYLAGLRANESLNAYASGESSENADGIYRI